MDLQIPANVWTEMQAVNLEDHTFEPNDIFGPEDVYVGVLSANLQRLYIVWRRAVTEAHAIQQEFKDLSARRDAIYLRSRGKRKELDAPNEARYQALEPVWYKHLDVGDLFRRYLEVAFSRANSTKKPSQQFRVIEGYVVVLAPIEYTTLVLK